MNLDVNISVQVGSFDLEVGFEVDRGETLAVLGPNGAGKTTLMRVLAGLLPPATGQVRLNGEMLDAPSAGFHMSPQERSVGVMFQDYLLFPGLTALDNVAYGLKARGRPRLQHACTRP